MTFAPKIAAGAAALALAAGGFGLAQTDLAPLSATETTTLAVGAMGCNDWTVQLTQGECWASGVIRYTALYNLQGAAQFCNWRKANPGEWSRLKGYAETETPPTQIVTWFGGSIRNQLEAYFATGAPMFTIAPNTAPNVCRTPLAPPTVQGVTPGETDVTVTVTS